MNKELLNENLNQILEGLKTVIDTANAELPAILEEIIRWGMFKYSVLTIISLVCLLLFVGTIILFIKNNEEPEAIAYTVLLSLIALIPFIYNLSKLLFVTISPKLYIIHYLKDLI
jgi:uncharacterized membrane protein YqjE